MHAAAYGGKDEAVRLLMAKGADEQAIEKHGSTPIDIALRCENETCVILMGGTVPSGSNGNKSSGGGSSGGGGVTDDVDTDDYDSSNGSNSPSAASAAASAARIRSSRRRSSSLGQSNGNGNGQGSTSTEGNGKGHEEDNEVTNPMMGRQNSIRAAARRSSLRKETPRDGVASAMAMVTQQKTASTNTGNLNNSRSTGDLVQAIFEFKAESSSEISLEVGMKYVVLKKESTSGWTYGQNELGEKGLFPTQYVEKM